MELNGQRLIPAGIEATWAALNDTGTLKACIAGCESLERTGDDAYSAVVAMKIGPVSARFRGNLRMTNIVAPHGYTMAFDGQGGVAGFGKGSADVTLTAQGPASTELAYAAHATVGGKMAQIGSRLIDATAAKITDDFFKAFEAHLQAKSDLAAAAGEGASPATSAAPASAVFPQVPAPLEQFPRAAPRPRQPIGGFDWVLAALVVAAAAYYVFR